ncbi:MAG: D-glucuronyl C5-epimerase family protein [Saprospiraceae bacterium]|nr:D-glucuronyl C5-epimerase family protein [Saprospiraceae bacterium]
MKKKLFMLTKLYRDLISSPSPINYDLGSELKYYYFKFENSPKKLNRLIARFDSNGVPMNRAYIDVEDGHLHYYPISIGQYGLAIYHDWLEKGEEKDKLQFIKIAEWFKTSSMQDTTIGTYWLTDIPKPEFNVYKPWKSAFTQSRGISIGLRAFQMTNDLDYYNMAKGALKPFLIDITNGGVSTGLKNDIIYEEYVASAPTRILDGAIFALFGIYDMIRVSKKLNDRDTSSVSTEIFNKGVEGLLHWLPKFDTGNWVYYNRCEIEGYPANDPCTIGYLKLVIAQLNILYHITQNEALKEYVHKFESYLKPVNILKMYIEKYKALKKLNRL